MSGARTVRLRRAACRRLAGTLIAAHTAGCGIDATVLELTPEPVRLSAGQYQTCAIRSDGVYCWGDRTRWDDVSETEVPAGTPDLAPMRVLEAAGWEQVASGAGHACALGDRRIWCWGRDDHGQLGGHGLANGDVPRPIEGLPAMAVLAAGYGHVVALDARAAVWSWGQNTYGALGVPAVAEDVDLAVRPPWPADWRAVSAGAFHTCGIDLGGTLSCWGATQGGRAGLGPSPPDTEIATPCAVDGGGSWRALDVGQSDGCAVRTTGELACWGSWNGGAYQAFSPTPVDGSDGLGWLQVSTDAFERCGIRDDGTLWCWGRNAEGQLGLGDNEDRATPAQVVAPPLRWREVSVGRFHMCALGADDVVYCAGENASGQLGLGDTQRRSTLTAVILP